MERRMKLEDKLKQRELFFKKTFGKRKDLHQLISEQQTFYRDYLQKCISLHSKVQVRGLAENMDDLLCKTYGLTDVLFNLDSRKRLEEKLKCVEINLDCSNKSLSISSSFLTYDKSYQEVDTIHSNFLPSIDPTPTLYKYDSLETIKSILQSERWIVIQGDPGSAKTTLLRWITRVFAESAHRGNDKIVFEEGINLPIRIPILIRISEFVAWLDQHQNQTLIDYIGQHTWFSEPYIHDDSGRMLKELVYHGHTLILLDGLDEIPEVGRRREIADHVRSFVDEYARTSEFFSAFDDAILDNPKVYSSNEKIVPMQSPSKNGGNQVVVTSRIVGYQLYPLVGTFIKHYSLLLMNDSESRGFVNEWILQVDKRLVEVFLAEGVRLDEKVLKTLLERRCSAIELIFKNGSDALRCNPAVLSLICMAIFQSPNDFCPKSRVEVYDRTVQSAWWSLKNKKLDISEGLLTSFLIELATYLHMHSPSGLIDAFDMKLLCCSVLQHQGVSNNRTKLRKRATELTSLLDSNAVIIVEQGLQVFGFLHLSFQEYFVAHSLVRRHSIDEVAKRILTYTINPRFRESLLLAVGWISWKCSLDEYDKFCNILVSPTEDYVFPFGALLFFDAYEDIQRLPSNTIIFTALNSLFVHPSNVIANTYFIMNLFKLSENIIIEWMQSHLKDNKHLFKFCRYLLTTLNQSHSGHQISLKSIPSIVYQQLWSFYNISTSFEFVIAQTLQQTMISENAPHDIFNDKLSSYFKLHNICASKIHPLILSIIIAVCGGISFKTEGTLMKIHFSTRNTHRESAILASIIEYFADNTESDPIKIQKLIKQYQNVLHRSSPSDTSTYIVDTFIALICLQGLLQPSIYQHFDQYKAFPLALYRLKHTWFYLKKIFDPTSIKYIRINKSFIISEVESIISMSFPHSSQSEEETIAFSLACAAACNKLGITISSDWSEIQTYCRNDDSVHLKFPSRCSHSNRTRKLHQINENTHPLQMFQHQPFFLLNFVPQSLQMLYYRITIVSTMPPVVLLSQCLMLLESFQKDDPNFYLAMSILQPLFKEHMLENYASVLFWISKSSSDCENTVRKDFIEATRARMSFDQSLIYPPKDWKILIDKERQRIYDAKKALQCHEKDLQLFAASISLAQLSRTYQGANQNNRSRISSKDVRSAIESIRNPVLRIIVLSIILDMKDPPIFDEEQNDILRWQMISQLQSLLPRLSLLESTLLFTRCHTVRTAFCCLFQQMASVIGKKLTEALNGKENQDQAAAFIALRQLDNSDLSCYLSEFVKQTKNWSDFLHFNSTIFFHYFTNKSSFGLSNTILLSSMYLAELVFDAQILETCTPSDQASPNSPLKELNQLWDNSSEDHKLVMTVKIATCITNYLQMSRKENISQTIKNVSDCLAVEKEAVPEIEKWLNYRMDKNLRFFAHYAALQLVMEGFNPSDLIDIINEMFDTDGGFRLESIIRHLLSSQLVNSTAVRQILIILNQKVYYPLNQSFEIRCKAMLQLILDLELERIISNIHKPSEISSNTFLSTFINFSDDLEPYLAKFLCTFLGVKNGIEDIIKEEYLAVVVKWIMNKSNWMSFILSTSTELYECLFMLLHDKRVPRAQKMVLNVFNLAFIQFMDARKLTGVYMNHILMQDDAITHLETVILSRDTYIDVLAACLLAYGNCLLSLQKFEMNRNVSNEMQIVFNTLVETSSSEIISIRAAFCLIFAHRSNITLDAIWNWFENKWNITAKKRYNILLQQTLYELEGFSSYKSVDEVVKYLHIHSSKLINIFVHEFYNYLCNKNRSKCLSDSAPDYVNIALKFIERNSNAFLNAVQKSFFGEKNFKTELYIYYINNATNSKASIELYAAFGVFTVELVDMLKRIAPSWDKTTRECLQRIKNVSDRDVIERLFEILDLFACDIKSNRFSFILILIVQLAQNDVVSLLEVHQRVSLLISNVSYQGDDLDWEGKGYNFSLLLNLSCIKKVSSSTIRETLITESHIDEEFEKEMKKLDRMFVPFVRRNYFLTRFQSISSNSN